MGECSRLELRGVLLERTQDEALAALDALALGEIPAAGTGHPFFATRQARAIFQEGAGDHPTTGTHLWQEDGRMLLSVSASLAEADDAEQEQFCRWIAPYLAVEPCEMFAWILPYSGNHPAFPKPVFRGLDDGGGTILYALPELHAHSGANWLSGADARSLEDAAEELGFPDPDQALAGRQLQDVVICAMARRMGLARITPSRVRNRLIEDLDDLVYAYMTHDAWRMSWSPASGSSPVMLKPRREKPARQEHAAEAEMA